MKEGKHKRVPAMRFHVHEVQEQAKLTGGDRSHQSSGYSWGGDRQGEGI